MSDPAPKLLAVGESSHRDEANETWLAWATRMLAHTLAELQMSPEDWTTHFKTTWPGFGYRELMESQARTLRLQIDNHQKAKSLESA